MQAPDVGSGGDDEEAAFEGEGEEEFGARAPLLNHRLRLRMIHQHAPSIAHQQHWIGISLGM